VTTDGKPAADYLSKNPWFKKEPDKKSKMNLLLPLTAGPSRNIFTAVRRISKEHSHDLRCTVLKNKELLNKLQTWRAPELCSFFLPCLA
jgi:hypothetical protein